MPKRARTEPGAFRIDRKRVGLTYSCPVLFEENPIPSREYIRDTLTEKFGQNLHIVCNELHESGKKHYHAQFNFDDKIRVTDPLAFDLKGIHPNILAPGKGFEGYVAKTGEYITNYFKRNPYAAAIATGSVSAGLELIALSDPGAYLRFRSQFESNLRNHLAQARRSVNIYDGPYLPSWYPVDWKPYTHSLLLWGPPGRYKTQYARYLMSHLFGEYDYIKGSHESVKKLSFTRPFIHDDVYMVGSLQPASNSREITDVESGGNIICRQSNVDIPPGIARIFISNLSHPFQNPSDSVYHRRLLSMELTV